MTPGLRRAAARRRLAAPPGVHLRAERRDHGRLDAEGRGPRLRALAHPETARALPRRTSLVLSGLAAQERQRPGRRPRRPRARRRPRYLTGVHPRKTAGADIQNGISVDQVAARAIGEETRFASLELGCEDSRTVGNCDSGYCCAYTNSISWRAADHARCRPRPTRASSSSACSARRRRACRPGGPRPARCGDRRSILDPVAERTRELSRDARAPPTAASSTSTSRRPRDRAADRAGRDRTTATSCPPIEKPTRHPGDFADYVKLMFDLQVVAFQADLTRVVTLMLGREGSLQTLSRDRRPRSAPPADPPPRQAGLDREGHARSTCSTWSSSRTSSAS